MKTCAAVVKQIAEYEYQICGQPVTHWHYVFGVPEYIVFLCKDHARQHQEDHDKWRSLYEATQNQAKPKGSLQTLLDWLRSRRVAV